MTGTPRNGYKAVLWSPVPQGDIGGEKMGGPSSMSLLFLLLLHGISVASMTTIFPAGSESLSEATVFPNVTFRGLNWKEASAAAPQLVSNISGSVDDRGLCHCSVFLPEDAFPAQRVEALEGLARSLAERLDRELSKVTEYMKVVDAYGQKLLNLTHKVEQMHTSQVSYTELDFEVLKLDIQEMESLVVQLKASMGDSNVIVQQLYVEIKNMSLAVTHLESLDKNNILAIRREIVALKQRLKECEEPSSAPLVQPGSCNHTGLVNISKPYPVQWNWRGSSFRYGVWGKSYSPDSPTSEVYWVAALNDVRLMQTINLYPSYDNLLLYRPSKSLDYRYGQGSGATVYKNFLYFNGYNSNYMYKLDVNSNSVVLSKQIPGAAYDNRFSYAGVAWQDIDFAVDETGLWAIYSTEANTGNIVISKLHEDTLQIQKTWNTRQYKPSVSSAFIICGVLYVTRSMNTKQEEVFYTFDTNTGKEGRISIMMEKPFGTVQGVDYHPSDHKLYVYNDGFLVTYDLEFQGASL
ncbi:olfactomedin-4-like [Rhineura floridana]|uniref:olfactomedin-4-like n=1 Tax=Rhineura floridana TaxID=261503 RepID=UPI002AC84ECF|nr:olfactomedin-4-like [Rhineura floridana]